MKRIDQFSEQTQKRVRELLDGDMEMLHDCTGRMNADTVRELARKKKREYQLELRARAERERAEKIDAAKRWFVENRQALEARILFHGTSPVETWASIVFGFHDNLFAETVFTLAQEYFEPEGFQVTMERNDIQISWAEPSEDKSCSECGRSSSQ